MTVRLKKYPSKFFDWSSGFSLILLALSVILLMTQCDTPDSVKPYQGKVFIKLFGGSGSEEGYDLKALDDGGFILVGSTTSYGHGDRDVYLVRTDSLGNQIWSQHFGDGSDDVGVSIILNPDHGFTICGWTVTDTINNEQKRDVYALKTDSQGNLLTSQRYGVREGDEFGTNIIDAPEGGYFITGTLDTAQFYLIKTDDNLEEQSSSLQGLQGSINLSAESIAMGNDTYYCFGTTNQVVGSISRKDTDFLIMIYDAQGRVVKNLKRIGQENVDDYGLSFATAFGESFLAAGYTLSGNRPTTFISKFYIHGNDIADDWQWTDDSQESTQAESVIRTMGGDFIVLNTLMTDIGNKDDFELVKLSINETGTPSVKWRHAFGSSDFDKARKVVELQNGSFVMIGTVAFKINEPNSVSKMCLMKVNKNGELIP